MSNSIKNLIQHSKNEPSLSNASTTISEDSGTTTEAVNSEKIKSVRSGSISSSKKKNETSSPSHRASPSSSPKQNSLYKLAESETKTSLNDIYISPSGEIRNAAKRASIKIQQQQQQQKQFTDLMVDSPPPPVPTSPLPSLQSENDIANKLNLNGKIYYSYAFKLHSLK
jgi:hypothetical protein